MTLRNVRRGFTLVELLVTIAILATVAVVVVVVLNPSQLLAQGRDSNRVSDVTDLTSVIGLYEQNVGGSMGSSMVVYVSIPDPSATTTAGTSCGTMGLPSLPSGYTYHCASTSTYRSVSGMGWIPLNLTNITNGSPITSLPADPTNASSSRFYYTYDTDGTHFEVTAVMESSKYKLAGTSDFVSPDGGVLASVYEKGTKLGLEPLDYGDPSLVGYWPLNEGTNTIAYDDSGHNATGTWTGALINGSHYTSGKVGGYAGNFDGSSTMISIATATAMSSFNFTGPITMSAWVYPLISNLWQNIIFHGSVSTGRNYAIYLSMNGTGYIYVALQGTNIGNIPLSVPWAVNAWNYIAVTANGSVVNVYVNGKLSGSTASALLAQSALSPLYIGYDQGQNSFYMDGEINDARVYNRALSAAEIQALYNGGK